MEGNFIFNEATRTRSRQPSLTNLTANAVGKVSRVTISGRDYFVAPITSIVTGVLPGSRGPLYYPPAEIEASVALWNGKPLTVGHPYDPINNSQLAADTPGVWDRQGIGFIGNTSYTSGKLKHTAYFDIERTKDLSKEIYNALLRNEVKEISTGLYTDNVEAPPGAAYNGRPYDYVAMAYRPDHMAVLVNGQRGACSIDDGCGLLVNANPEGINQYGSPGHAKRQLEKRMINSTKHHYPDIATSHKGFAVHRNSEGFSVEGGPRTDVDAAAEELSKRFRARDAGSSTRNSATDKDGCAGDS